MKQYINKKVKISVKPNNRLLTFTATIKEVNDTHITFLDKFDTIMTYRISDIVEIQKFKEVKK